MNFNDFKAEFMKENRKLRVCLGVSVIIFSIGTISSLTQRKYFLYKGQAIFEERLLAEEVCRIAFTSLVEGQPNKHLIADGILKLVKKDPFTMEVKKILKLKSSEEGSCEIILSSQNKLLAFKILLETKEANPFYYKLTEIQELATEEEG